MQADRGATRVRLHGVVSRRCMICQKVGVVAGLLAECASWRDRGVAQMHDLPAGRQAERLAGGIGIAKPGDDRCRMIGWARSRRTPEWQGECVEGADAPRVPICPVSDSPGFDLSRSVLICPVCPVSGPSGPVPPRFASLDVPSLCRKLGANWANPAADFPNWADRAIWSPKIVRRCTGLPSLRILEPDLPGLPSLRSSQSVNRLSIVRQSSMELEFSRWIVGMPPSHFGNSSSVDGHRRSSTDKPSIP